MNSYPLVTIGIPNYNYAGFITEALDSVIEQDYENIEILVIDDCSTDNSIEVIEEWINAYTGNKKVGLIKNRSNLGLTKTCNLILKNASGKYFQPLDADDLLLPGKISKQVELLELNEKAGLVYSNAFVIDSSGNIIQQDYLARIKYNKDEMPSGMIHPHLLKFNFIVLPSVLINTEKARAIGGFDESLQVQDYYMWLKLAETHEILYLNKVTAKYRVHANSMGSSSATNTRSEDSVLQIKYRYYATSSEEIKKNLQVNIQNSSVYLYQEGYPTAAKWIKLAFRLKPGVKTFFYYVVSSIGIPFSFVKKLKRIVG